MYNKTIPYTHLKTKIVSKFPGLFLLLHVCLLRFIEPSLDSSFLWLVAHWGFSLGTGHWVKTDWLQGQICLWWKVFLINTFSSNSFVIPRLKYSPAQIYPNYAYAYYTFIFCVYEYVYTRIRVCQCTRICPFVMPSHKFLYMKHCWSNKGHIWEWKGFKAKFAYC